MFTAGSLPARAAKGKLNPRLHILHHDHKNGGGAKGFSVSESGKPDDPFIELFLVLRDGVTREQVQARYPNDFLGILRGKVMTARMHASSLDLLAADPGLNYAEAASQAHLAMDVVKSTTTTGGLIRGVVDPSFPDFGTNQGQGIVIGFVDSGIDWKHKDFIDESDPTQSRILYIWDQTDSGGPAPGASPFNTGTEWTQAQINTELTSAPGIVREVDTEGHGTHVAGIAAGNGKATDGNPPAGTYVGMAPKADIIMVKSNLTNTQIINGVDYIIAQARALGKRAVINLSLSSQDGPHDGTFPVGAHLSPIAVSTPVVISAGNEQERTPHVRHIFPGGGNPTFSYQIDGTAASQMFMDFWGNAGDGYTVEITDHQGSTVTVLNGVSNPSASLGSMTVGVENNTNTQADPEIYIKFSGTISQTLFGITFTRTFSAGTGVLDGWVTDWKIAKFTGAGVDNDRTIGDFGVTDNAITVGSYCSRGSWPNTSGGISTDPSCNGNEGEISVFSSHGPTRDGRQKPNIAGPGERVLSALSANMSPAESNTNIGSDNRRRAIQGTSMSAPVVSGYAALKLQIDPTLTAAQILADIQATARTDAQVGAVPNTTWGYGKLTAKACGLPLTGGPTINTPTTHGTSSITWTWNALSGANTYNLYYDTAPSTLITNTSGLTYTLTNLAGNTTYALLIKGVNTCGTGGGSTSTSTATLSVPLAGGTMAPEISSVTVSYTALAGQNEGYLLQASTSPSFALPLISSATPTSTLASLRLDGLNGLTTYYFRLATLNKSGAATFVTIGSTLTHTSLVSVASITFSFVSTDTLRPSWVIGANPAGLQYVVNIATRPDFIGAAFASSETFNLHADFYELPINTTHYFRVRATTGPFGSAFSTSTLSLPPTITSSPFTQVFQSSASVEWSNFGNPAGTRMLVETSSAAGFTTIVVSSETYNTSIGLTSLAFNTTVYARIRTFNHNNVPSAYLEQSTSTLALPPTLAPKSFLSVTSSMTVAWTALASSPQNLSAEGYLVDASTSPDFYPIASSLGTSDVSKDFLNISGLLFNTTYYLRVGSLNWNRVPNYILLGSSLTVTPILSSATINNSADITLSLAPSVNELTFVQVNIPPGSFPAGINVSVNASVPFEFDPSQVNQGKITPLGDGVAVDIDAEGLQPLQPVALRMDYDPLFLPTGMREDQLVIGNQRDGHWVLLDTVVDTANNILRAETNHFSLFAPFGVSAGTELDNVSIFPIPWMPGSGDPLFDATQLTFSNLPEDGKVRLYSILGELVWEDRPRASGLLFWNGKNRRGADVGSGTYLGAMTGAGGRKTTRVVIIR